MRNQTKIKQLLIAHLEAIISKQGHIMLTAENVKSIIGGAINRCYEEDSEVNKISLNLPVSGSSPVDDRDNPLIGEDDSWIHDVDMGAR